jgi:hypothetical protein
MGGLKQKATPVLRQSCSASVTQRFCVNSRRCHYRVVAHRRSRLLRQCVSGASVRKATLTQRKLKQKGLQRRSSKGREMNDKTAPPPSAHVAEIYKQTAKLTTFFSQGSVIAQRATLALVLPSLQAPKPKPQIPRSHDRLSGQSRT